MNRTVLVGRLTKDPELKYTQSGIALCRFTVAVNRPFTNQQGERQADFINCMAWRKQAENLANYMRKGSMVGVDGRIETDSFEGQDGKRVFTTNVVADNIQFLETKQQQQSRPQEQSYQPPAQGYQNSAPQGYQPPQNDPFQPGGGPIEINDDSLPF